MLVVALSKSISVSSSDEILALEDDSKTGGSGMGKSSQCGTGAIEDGMLG